MKILVKPALAVGLALAAVSSPLAVSPVAAQDARGIGWINVTGVIVNSTAYQTAETQRETTYKAQFDQAKTRQAQLEAQIKPLADKFNADRKAANPNKQALQQQLGQIQQIQQAGEQELQQIMAPIALSRAYVTEQIRDRLDAAIKAAADKKKVTLVLNAENGDLVYADPAHNMNQAVLAELNATIPSAQLVPPDGWLPREVREQQAQQAAAAGQAPAASQPQQPSGR